MPDELWLTKKELADALKVSTRTIERAQVPCIVVGSQNRYRISEVEKALRSKPVASDRIEVVLTLTEEEYRNSARASKQFAIWADRFPRGTPHSFWSPSRTWQNTEFGRRADSLRNELRRLA